MKRTFFLIGASFILMGMGKSKNTQTPPHPFDISPQSRQQVQRLWPSDSQQQSKQREEEPSRVRAEWLAFGRNNPDNQMVPWEVLGVKRPDPKNLLMVMAMDSKTRDRISQEQLLEHALTQQEVEIDPLTQEKMEDRLRELRTEEH